MNINDMPHELLEIILSDMYYFKQVPLISNQYINAYCTYCTYCITPNYSVFIDNMFYNNNELLAMYMHSTRCDLRYYNFETQCIKYNYFKMFKTYEYTYHHYYSDIMFQMCWKYKRTNMLNWVFEHIDTNLNDSILRCIYNGCYEYYNLKTIKWIYSICDYKENFKHIVHFTPYVEDCEKKNKVNVINWFKSIGYDFYDLNNSKRFMVILAKN